MILPGGIIGGALPEIFYRETATATAGNPRTLAGMTFGDAAPRRLIVLSIGSIATGGAISAVTIGGVSATLAVSSNFSASYVDIWYANVPTGTTGNVVITQAGIWNRVVVSLYAVYGLRSFTPTATATDTDNNATVTLSLNVNANGVVVAGAWANFLASSTPAAATWNGLTENWDTAYDTTRRVTSASGLFTTVQTPATITCTGMTGNTRIGASAAFR